MSTLSKVLVVLLVLLAIAHSAVLLAYLSQQQDWKALAVALQDKLDNTQALKDSQAIAYEQTCKQLSDEKRALQDQVTLTKTDLIKAQDTIAGLRLELGKLTAEKESLQRDLTKLTASLGLAQEAQKHAISQLDTARDTANTLKAENAQLEEQVSQLTMDVSNLTAEVRNQKQQIFSLQSGIRKAQGVVSTKAPATAVELSSVTSVQPIKGKVTGVDLAANIAQINVGEIAGVAEGIKFVIYDRDGYVGDLRITRVLRDQSLGTIVLSSKPVEVGDEVATELK